MIPLLRTLLTLVWSLWFGGMVALLIFVIRLFKTSHDTGVVGAPVLFTTFATYQLILGMIALLLAVTLALLARAWARAKMSIASVLLAVALVCAFPIQSWTIEMNGMRKGGQMSSARFAALHRRSEGAYSVAAIALLLAGISMSLAQTSKQRV